MSSDVREGFLCPICMCDLGDEIQLQVHFEERHSKEDPVFLQSIKDLFGKAKKKILNNSQDYNNPADQQEYNFFSFGLDAKTAVSGIFASPGGGDRGQAALAPSDHDPVSGVPFRRARDLPGPKVVDHTHLFREERTRKLERNKSTNQVLIRLEKLMTNLPSDPGKRRAHERAAVSWVEEDLVKLCPYCAKSFNVAARRKHHCRLCGAVLCNDCSTAVSFDFARKVTNPATISKFHKSEESSDEPEEQSTPKSSKLSGLFKSKHLSGSHESLNSLRTLMDLKAEEQFRSCHLCLEILERQDSKVEKATAEPILVQFYERLQVHLAEGKEKGATYRAMSESLDRGEEDFGLSEAKLLRVKILKIAENVDLISKKISVLDTDYDGENPGFPSGLQLQLQQRIRMSAVNFVKEGLVGLPGLPSEEEFEALKKRRREDAVRRVAEEKQAARLAKLRFEQESSKRSTPSRLNTSIGGGGGGSESPSHGTPRGVKHSNGLVLSSSSHTCSSDDPVVQQIHNIKEFIKEARRLGKFDEVSSLEANLGELQAEYRKGQKELEDNYKAFGGLFHKTSPAKSAAFEKEEEDAEDDYDSSGKNPFV